MNAEQTPSDVTGTYTVTSTVQQPGETIKPMVGDGTVEEIVERLYGFKPETVQELNSYDDRNYHIKPHRDDPMAKLHPLGCIMKITNSMDSRNQIFLEAQHSLMAHLTNHAIPAQQVIKNNRGGNYSLETIYADVNKQGSYAVHLVELRTYLSGKIILEVPYSPDLLYKGGELLADVALALKDFDHIFYKDRTNLWSIVSVPMITDYTFCIEDTEDRHMVEEVVDAFNKHVVSNYDNIPKGYIHGDPNEQNILVTEGKSQGTYDISGILDYTDASKSYPVMDIATHIAYMMLDSEIVDQLDVPGHILAGYLSIRQLQPIEWAVLPYCITGRLAQSLTLGAHAYSIDPENTYVLTTAAKGWPLLRKLWSHSIDELICRWKAISEDYKK